MKINLFGGFSATREEGKALSFSSKKAQALLAYLAVESDRPQSRERLASMLWADTGEERARHNLRQSVAKIRQALGDIVASEGECLCLVANACITDVGEFESLAAADNADDLQHCLDLYQGEFLAGLELREPEFSDWLLMVRGRLRQKACEVAAALADKLIAQGNQEDAIKTLCKLLAIDPAEENAHRQLMQLYADCGRRSEALRQYQRCEFDLERELGATPDAKTKALFETLKDEPAKTSAPLHENDGAAPAVAVLPFDNLSGDDDAYFVDGIAEDLITALSCFHSLAVISRGSVFTYRDQSVSEKEIARQLGAQFLVRGSVRRSNNRVRINVQLTDAGAGLQVWAHRYDREMEDVFALQDEITSTLVSTLAGRVEAARLSHARKAAPERLDAYDLVLRGKDHHHRFTAEDCALCIEMFQRAVDRDPSFAAAHAWLACAYGQAIVFGLEDAPKLVDKSQAAAEQGLALDDNESEAHRVLAQVQLTRGDLERALWHQDRALFLNPNDDRILCAQGEILTFVGKAEEGEHWVRKSMRLNPYHPQRYWTHLARALFHRGLFEEALAALDNISKPRMDDLAYRIAAAHKLNKAETVTQAIADIRSNFPDFRPDRFMAALSYTSDEYRAALETPLMAAM
jgi:DNA-binding SARP family transcriptional activator